MVCRLYIKYLEEWLQKKSTEVSATENDWQDIDGQFDFDWFELNQLPTFLRDVRVQPNENGGKFKLYKLMFI